MRISDIISKISIDGQYSAVEAGKLYKNGVDYKLIELATWIGLIKNKFYKNINDEIDSGFCFEYESECKLCPIQKIISNGYSLSCCDEDKPVDTIKAIVKTIKNKKL